MSSLRLELDARESTTAASDVAPDLLLDDPAGASRADQEAVVDQRGHASSLSSSSSQSRTAPSTFKSYAELDAAQALLGVSPNTVVGPCAPLHGFTTAMTRTTTTTTTADSGGAQRADTAMVAGYASSSIPSWARGNAITQAQPLRFVTAPLPKRSHDEVSTCIGSSNGINNSNIAVGALIPRAEAAPCRDNRAEETPTCTRPASLLSDQLNAMAARRERSGSVGLDALAEAADVATEEHIVVVGAYDEHQAALEGSLSSTSATSNLVSSGHATSASGSSAATASEDESSDDSEMMPPPPPRSHQPMPQHQIRRPRSVSNPEGMMTNMNMTTDTRSHSNNHFRLVLPEAVLEEELARVRADMKRRRRNYWGVKMEGTSTHQPQPGSIPEEEEGEDEEEDMYEGDEDGEAGGDGDDEREMDEDDEAGSHSNEKLDSEELLRRARARLFEDLMLEGKMGSGAVEKGFVALPHSFDKYKEVYNKDGRIGIYTPTERAAIIERFLHKRRRRVWNKKIRYDCRKNLADRRLRVKGRFVKRSEQEQLERRQNDGDEDDTTAADTAVLEDAETMPDVNDPEAGFAPTEDLPYRRLRRHTVT